MGPSPQPAPTVTTGDPSLGRGGLDTLKVQEAMLQLSERNKAGARMCVCVCARVCVCMHMYMCVHVCLCMCACLQVCVHMCAYTCAHVSYCACVHACVHMCTYVHVHIYVCVCICVCTTLQGAGDPIWVDHVQSQRPPHCPFAAASAVCLWSRPVTLVCASGG